jgi:hypothetical protein
MKKTSLIIATIVSGCFFVFAQITQSSGGSGSSTINYSPFTALIALIQSVFNRLVPLIIGIAVLGFFWFIIQFIWMAKDNPDAQNKAKTGIMWSLIALFCIVCVWGIIQLLASILGIGLGGSAQQFKLPGEL